MCPVTTQSIDLFTNHQNHQNYHIEVEVVFALLTKLHDQIGVENYLPSIKKDKLVDY